MKSFIEALDLLALVVELTHCQVQEEEVGCRQDVALSVRAHLVAIDEANDLVHTVQVDFSPQTFGGKSN